ncbi:hypothetical protein EBT16_13340 [bacterium]|nr:hypothetical protein [bacterium]
MATKRQQERKKIARKQKAKARVVVRRHKLDEARRQERRSLLLERKFRDKIAPIVKNTEAKKRMDEAEKNRSLKKLERNAEILKALEEEYLKEKEQKKALNESLESEGHLTLDQKIGALEDKARSSMEGEEKETGQIDLTAKFF